jgi:hypothetical protein
MRKSRQGFPQRLNTARARVVVASCEWQLVGYCGTGRGTAMIRIFEIVGAVVGAGLLILSVRLDDMRQRSKQRRSGEANGAHLSDPEEIAG